MKVMIVGAGAVGAVYGHHLQAAGHHVGLFVKDKYAAHCRQGLRLYCHNDRRYGTFVADEVLTAPRAGWDQVWLCISADALRGPWLQGFLGAVGDAVVISMVPGAGERTLLADLVPAERLGAGLIALISYHAPLPGEAREPCIAYWHAPMARTLLFAAGAAAAAQALAAGGCPAKVAAHDDAMAFGSAILMPLIHALERAGWAFGAFRRGPWASSGARAARQAGAIIAADLGRAPPWYFVLCDAPLLQVALPVVPWLMPFDLETYLRVHFTKVRAQTLLMLEYFVARGRALGLPHDAVALLLQ
jgi:2-dehydropantoate 2-reductase